MRTDWTLTIDLRQNRDALLLELGLFGRDRRHRWKAGREVFVEMFRSMAQDIEAFFDEDVPPGQRKSKLELFRQLAHRSFVLDEFLGGTDFSDGDTLTINTLVTVIPWDLLPYHGGFLGHCVSLGLRIPTPRHGDPLGVAGEGRSRFLHVVANPRGDLPNSAEEARQLECLVANLRDVDYELLLDPTPVELIRAFSAGRSTPFVHFTGHVVPKQGLLLKGGLLSIENIVRYFPCQPEQVVFLNGCDDVYEDADPSTAGQEPDMFQPASVANAFLDGGAEAVIAPRSRVADADACVAAGHIWERILTGEGLGTAVRVYREQTARERPEASCGYSYLLYGDPSTFARRHISGLAAPGTSRAEPCGAEHEALREAWGDASGPVAPRHIFAALTRRWLIGHIYFTLEGQRYFVALEQLRRELEAASPPPSPPPGAVQFSPAGRLAVDRAVAASMGRDLDDLALLEGVAEVNDPEVRCALEALGRGPRTVEACVRAARAWASRGRPIPEAVIAPDGSVNVRLFLPDLGGAVARKLAVASTVDCWDLFSALVAAGGRTAAVWSQACPVAPHAGEWAVGCPLHWGRLKEPLREAISTLAVMVELEGDCRITEGRLVYCLADGDVFDWYNLPTEAQEWLRAQSVDKTGWREFVDALRMSSIAWV